jgi:hypothetical protein
LSVKKTYIVNYTEYYTNKSHEKHSMKIHNCLSELHAKIRLGEYLRTKHTNFSTLTVHDCKHDTLQIFNDLFGSNNPFK